MSARGPSGILEQMPASIAYMKAAGIAANEVAVENEEDNEALTKKIESVFRVHFSSIPKAEGLQKLKVDDVLLFDWLKAHPSEKYPETLGLYVVSGMLAYLDYIYD